MRPATAPDIEQASAPLERGRCARLPLAPLRRDIEPASRAASSALAAVGATEMDAALVMLHARSRGLRRSPAFAPRLQYPQQRVGLRGIRVVCRPEARSILHGNTPREPEFCGRRRIEGMRSDRKIEGLVRKAHRGCRESADKIILHYQHDLLCLIRARLGKGLRGKIEEYDVYQDTALRAWRSIQSPKFQWQGAARFWAWLGRIVEHVILNEAARQKVRRIEVPLGDRDADDGTKDGPTNGRHGPGPPADCGPTPASILQAKERFERLQDALASLPPHHKEVIILARIRKLPLKEIAGLLGMPSEGAVSALIRRALRSITIEFGLTTEFLLPSSRSLDPELRDTPERGGPVRDGPEHDEPQQGHDGKDGAG
jgi:RNA polymerase sigma factor (sigma-70 family)